jgi:micrococcal nuclease
MSKKQLKILSTGFVLLLSIVVIFFTDNSSKLVSPFEKNNPEVTSTNQQVQGSQITSFPTKLNSVEELDTQNPSRAYRVLKVVDGDTLDVEIDGASQRLRLIGIDTPETVDPRKAVQCFGKEASNKAKELLENNFVTLESDETQGEKDKYGRLLRYVFLPDGTNFNLFMIEEGYAHEYTYSTRYKYQDEFRQAEVNARNNNKGLWSPTTCSGNK